MLSVTWRFDTPCVISYWWSFGTESLSPAVFEILHSKRNRVTSLTFHGHVTSSITWPFDSPYAISYWWSFGTKPLSLTVSQIFNVECNAMVDVTLTRPLNKDQVIHFGINRFLIYDYSNFCSTHSLATIHSLQTDDRQTQHSSISATVGYTARVHFNYTSDFW